MHPGLRWFAWSLASACAPSSSWFSAQVRARLTRPPSAQSPFAWSGRYPFQGGLRAASKSVTSPSSLVWAHASDQVSPTGSVFLARRVLAGCCQPLLGPGPSRHYLCDPCAGAWTHTPPRSPGALAPFFPGDDGLAPRETRLARGTISAMQLPQRAVFRGCSHSFTFRLPRSLGPQVAPTATDMLPGGRAVYTTHCPKRLPALAVVSLRVRHGQLTRLDSHQLDRSLAGCSFPHPAFGQGVHAVAHGRLRVRSLRRVSPSFS